MQTIHFYVSFKSSAVSLAATVAYGRDLSVCLGPGTFTQLSPRVLSYQGPRDHESGPLFGGCDTTVSRPYSSDSQPSS